MRRTDHLATWDGADQFTPHEVAVRPRNVHFDWDTARCIGFRVTLTAHMS